MSLETTYDVDCDYCGELFFNGVHFLNKELLKEYLEEQGWIYVADDEVFCGPDHAEAWWKEEGIDFE